MCVCVCVVGMGVGQAGKVEGGVRLDMSPPLSLENEAATLSLLPPSSSLSLAPTCPSCNSIYLSPSISLVSSLRQFCCIWICMLILFWDHTRLYVDKTPDLLDFLELTNAQGLVVVFVILGCLRVNFLIKRTQFSILCYALSVSSTQGIKAMTFFRKVLFIWFLNEENNLRGGSAGPKYDLNTSLTNYPLIHMHFFFCFLFFQILGLSLGFR